MDFGDEIVNFVRSEWADARGSNAARKPTGGDASPKAAKAARYIPVSPVVVAVVAVVVWSGGGQRFTSSPTPAVRGVGELLAAIADWLPLVMLAAVALIALDVLRFNAYRHRVALRVMVVQATGREPSRVRVGLWTPPGPVRSARIKLPRGTVIPEDRLSKFRTALESTDSKVVAHGQGWDDEQ